MKRISLIYFLVACTITSSISFANNKDLISFRICKNLSSHMLETLNIKVDIKNKLIIQGYENTSIYQAKINKKKIKSTKLIKMGDFNDKDLIKSIEKVIKFSYEIDLNSKKITIKTTEKLKNIEISKYQCD